MTCLHRSRNGMLHRDKIAAQPIIIGLPEPLQIDIHRIDQWQQLLQRLRFDHAIGDKYRAKSLFLQEPRRIPYIFITDQRLIVGECYTDIPRRCMREPHGQFHETFR